MQNTLLIYYLLIIVQIFHNGGEEILLIFGDCSAKSHKQWEMLYRYYHQRKKSEILEQMAWKVCELSITGGF